MSTATTPRPFPTADRLVVTDAGLETWLMFHRGADLPAFAAYPLAVTEDGRALLREYYAEYAEIARGAGTAVLLDAPTWRANPDWARSLRHGLEQLGACIDASVTLLTEMRASWDGQQPFLVGGAVGPRGDGYRIEEQMSVEEAEQYHSFQIERMAAAGVDVVEALTMGYVEEAAGIALAARRAGVPVVISFTVETDGRLPSGATLGDAIRAVDTATDAYPHHYMINCAHPTHFADAISAGEGWIERIGGLRANASALTHAELDEMEELDEGDPADLAARYVGLRPHLPHLQVLGGCCGTDHRHVAAIAAAWLSRARSTSAG